MWIVQLLIIIIVIVLLLVYFMCCTRLHKEGFTEDNKIPRQIWCYWNNNDPPPLILKCLKNWQRMNPDHKITLVKPSNFSNYITTSALPTNFDNLTPQRQADWIRLYLLYKYGGFWIDTSTILTKSLEWIHSKNVSAFGFYLKGFTTIPMYPVIESWFIAAVPHHPFIIAWFNEFDRICRIHGNDGNAYIDELKSEYGDDVYKKLCQDIIIPDYLTIHLAAQKVMQIGNIKPYVVDIAEDNPFYIISNSNWDSSIFVKKITEEYTDTFLPSVIKLRGSETSALREYLDTNESHSSSIYARFVEN